MWRPRLHRLFPIVIACLILVMPYAEAQAAPLMQESANSYQGIVNSTANIRSGPGLDYPVVDQAQAGQVLTVVACNEDCSLAPTRQWQLDCGLFSGLG